MIIINAESGRCRWSREGSVAPNQKRRASGLTLIRPFGFHRKVRGVRQVAELTSKYCVSLGTVSITSCAHAGDVLGDKLVFVDVVELGEGGVGGDAAGGIDEEAEVAVDD